MSNVEIDKDAGSTFSHGSVAVGVTAVQLSATAIPCLRGVSVKADPANTGIIYVGRSNAVTAGSAGSTDGYPLSAGEELPFPIDDASKIWAIASAVSQKLFFIGG